MPKTKEKINPNSALYWFPLIQKAGLPVPKTEFFPIDWPAAEAVLLTAGEDDGPEYNPPFNDIRKACERIGYPCFLRTDESSAKHDGPDSYLISEEKDIPTRVWRTLEDNGMKELYPRALMLREFLHLKAPFKAFNGHPIAEEWRVFASLDGVYCSHPYWPEDAIQFYGKAPDAPADWRESLAKLYSQMLPTAIYAAAEQAATVCPAAAAWSVDFAYDLDGKAWLIDMAVAAASWHTEGCPQAKTLARISAPRGKCAKCQKQGPLVLIDLMERGFCETCAEKEKS